MMDDMKRTYRIEFNPHISSDLEPFLEDQDSFKEFILALKAVKKYLNHYRYNLLAFCVEDGKKINTIRYFGLDAPAHAIGGWLPVRGGREFALAVAEALYYGDEKPELYDYSPEVLPKLT